MIMMELHAGVCALAPERNPETNLPSTIHVRMRKIILKLSTKAEESRGVTSYEGSEIKR